MTDPTAAPPPTATRPGGRRAAPAPRRRLRPAAVLAVVVPLATVAAAFGLGPDAARTAADALPEQVALSEQTLVCPPPDGAPAPVVVGRAPALDGAAGEGDVDVTGVGGTTTSVDPPVGGSVGEVVVPEEPAVVEGRGPAAPGLLAGRFATGTTAGAACLPPAADQWFTGLGAGPERSSVLELVNPDSGPAVADVTLLGPDGPLDVPDVAGVTVPPGERLTLELGEITPTADELAAQVQVVRGRLGVSVLDRVTPVGGAATTDWLPSQPAPGTDLLLPGLPGGEGARDLVVANPGTTATQVDVQVATPGGAVTPVGVRPLQVPARGTAVLDLAAVLRTQVDEGAQGLVLSASSPVTATLRSVVRDDLALTTAVAPAATTAGLVPDGEARVVLTAPTGGGATGAEVTARDADGDTVGTESVDLGPGAVAEVDLPEDATSVSVAGEGPLAGSVVVRRGDGTLVLPLRAPVVDGLVPAVRPGLP